MLPIKINNRPVNIPQSWSELTLAQYCEITINAARLNQLRLFAIISGEPYSTLINLPDGSLNLKLDEITGWINEKFEVNSLARPQYITIGEKKIEPPADPAKKTLGQKLLLQSIVRVAQESSAMMCTVIAPAVAIYCQPLIDGKPFDDERIEAITTKIMKCKMVDVYPWGAFFLSGYMVFVPSKQNTVA